MMRKVLILETTNGDRVMIAVDGITAIQEAELTFPDDEPCCTIFTHHFSWMVSIDIDELTKLLPVEFIPVVVKKDG